MRLSVNKQLALWGSRAASFVGPLCLALFAPLGTLAADTGSNSGSPMLHASDPLSGWENLYFGISAGGLGLWSEPTVTAAPSPEVFGLFGPLTDSEHRSLSSTLHGSAAGLMGAQLGFNHVVGRLLLGGEVDFNAATARDLSAFSKTVRTEISAGTPDDVVVPVVFNYRGRISHAMPWVATARARLGYLATERTVLYATGGLALGQIRTTHTATVIPVGAGLPQDLGMSYSDERRRTRLGVTLGAGLEYAFTDSISLKAEYLYVALGRSSSTIEPSRDPDDTIPLPAGAVSASSGAAGSAPFVPGASITVRDGSQFHAIRIGINFRF